MASYNRVMLMGNLTRDPELRYTPSQYAVTELGIAVNDKRKNAQGEWVDEVTFVDVTLWGRTAEVACEYLKKGAPVFIEGRLKLDSWEAEGKKHYKLRVVGERMQMLGTRGGSGGAGGSGGGAGRPQTQYDESEYGGRGGDEFDAPRPAQASAARPPDDDIPF